VLVDFAGHFGPFLPEKGQQAAGYWLLAPGFSIG
jgi:hypothetical protein